jgi:hypothetical protein
MTELVYQTTTGEVLRREANYPYRMPYVGQAAFLPSEPGPLVVQEIHGTRERYVAVVGAPPAI